MNIDRRRFTRNDKPFFWLADTAWNAPLRGTEDQWHEYLDTRAHQGFTVIQFVATQWRGSHNPRYGRLYEVEDKTLRLNEAAFQQMDHWINLIRQYGLVPAPVMLWANTPTCPGQALSEEHCIALGQHMVSRWGDDDIVWILAGDGRYESEEQVARWSRIGRGIFGDSSNQFVTMHPCGISWVGDAFANEPWYSFVGIQSGHGASKKDLSFLLQEDYVNARCRIEKPFINLEPNYEMAYAYHEGWQFTDYEVRRASYWSLLMAPTAGVTYGSNAIWVWALDEQGETAEGHGSDWIAPYWREGLETPGTTSMSVLAGIIQRLPWTELSPRFELLANQPGKKRLEEHIAISSTADGLIVAYLPVGGELPLRPAAFPDDSPIIHRVDPRTGEWHAQQNLDTPQGPDWLLVIGQSGN